MFIRSALAIAIVFALANATLAQESQTTKPIELEVLKSSVGVWDAEFEVWPQGLDADSMKFKGVETNSAFGQHWVASDLDTEFDGQIMRVHSIVGYDLDQKKMVGTIIDHGPYKATMVGDYDEKTKTLTWMTEAKDLSGKRMVQKTSITAKSADERELILMVPGEKDGEFVKMMQIQFVRRK